MGSDMTRVVKEVVKGGRKEGRQSLYEFWGEEDGLEDGGILSAGGRRGLAGRDLWLSGLQNCSQHFAP